jgi:RHS repeat-associated protein
VRRGKVIVTPPFDKPVEFDREEAEHGAYSDGAWILARDLKTGGYRLDANTDFRQHFEPAGADQKRFRLSAIEDPNHNRLTLRYDDRGTLVGFVDSASRRIDLETTPGGHWKTLRATDPESRRTVVFSRYTYDQRERLVEHVDVEGAVTRYEYDDNERITLLRYPTGLVFHFRYDGAGRCIETWGEYPGRTDPALAPELPKVLADGQTRARGIYHVKIEFGDDGYSEVVDSVRILRFFADQATGMIAKAVAPDGGVTTRSFDDAGNIASRMDPEGATASYQWDGRGRLLQETDPLGRNFIIERDAAGRVVRNVDKAGGVVSCWRDARGNAEAIADQEGAVTTYRYDARGLLVEQVDARGGRTTYVPDAHGNLTEMRVPNGGVWHWEWDYFGRLVRRIDPNGREELVTSSDGGEVLAVTDSFTGYTIRYAYDELGRCVAEARPEGTTYYEWGGFGWLASITRPANEVVRLQWNREGWLLRVLDERGEPLEYDYTSTGYVRSERMFGGATTQIRWDRLGRPTEWRNARGETTEYSRNLMGRITDIAWPDGTKATIDYDARDEETSSRGWWGATSVVRNRVGHVLREEHEVGDRRFWVELERDSGGKVIGRRTSLGYAERVERDAGGYAQRYWLDDERRVDIERTIAGVVRSRHLPEGGVIAYESDPACRRTSLRVSPRGAGASPGSTIWQTPSAPGGAFERQYHYSPRGDLLSVVDHGGSTTQYAYDVQQRLLSVQADGRLLEAFAWDAASNGYEVAGAPLREYDVANRLLRRGDVTYKWDEAGFLVERQRLLADGAVEQWRYFWDGQDHLGAVELPDGRRVEFLYDRWGRRLRKRVFARPPAMSAPALSYETYYVWSTDKLIHELHEGDGVTRLRTFVYDDYSTMPWAHEDALLEGDQRTSCGWVYYANEPTGFPAALVAGDGDVLATHKHTAYGALRAAADARATTAARFAGQWADEETGLCYNRYRYYDPEAGRYISPDPLGPDAGFNVYRYCPNPVGYCDPVGLDAHGCTSSLTLNEEQGGGTYVPTPNGKDKGDSRRRRGEGVGVGSPSDILPGCRSTMGHEIPGASRVDRPLADTERQALRSDGLKNTNTNQSIAHTEQNAIEWAETRFGGRLQGSKMNLGGDYPPCPRCHRAMQEFAARHGAKVDYNWPQNNRLNYDGTKLSSDTPTRRAASTGHGKWGEKLAGTYNTHEKNKADFGHNMRSKAGEGGFNPDEKVRGSYDEIWERQRREGSLGGGAARPAGMSSPIAGETAYPAEHNRPIPQTGRDEHALDDHHRSLPPTEGQRTGQGGGTGRYGKDGKTVELTRMMGDP